MQDNKKLHNLMLENDMLEIDSYKSLFKNLIRFDVI